MKPALEDALHLSGGIYRITANWRRGSDASETTKHSCNLE